jgi:hypothetical protein
VKLADHLAAAGPADKPAAASGRDHPEVGRGTERLTRATSQSVSQSVGRTDGQTEIAIRWQYVRKIASDVMMEACVTSETCSWKKSNTKVFRKGCVSFT